MLSQNVYASGIWKLSCQGIYSCGVGHVCSLRACITCNNAKAFHADSIHRPGDANARTPLLSSDDRPRSLSPSKPKQNDAQYLGYGNGSVDALDLDSDEEDLYNRARALEYGDWNVSWFSVQAQTFVLTC